MSRTDTQNEKIDEIIQNLKEQFVIEFGTPSRDELSKMAATKDLYKMTNKAKGNYISTCRTLSVLPPEEYISYMLTLMKLISCYGQEILARYIITSSDAENGIIEGKLEQLLYSFNQIPTSEYEKYQPLLTNLTFVNHVANADRVNVGMTPHERLGRKHLKIDYAISKYRENSSTDNKWLIDQIVKDIDNHLELKQGKIY